MDSSRAVSHNASAFGRSKLSQKNEDKAAALKALEEAKQAALEAARKPPPPPPPTEEQNLFDLTNWIYSIPYSRRLSFIPRDFSDGVLVAEVIKHFIPELVDIHNYSHANGLKNKTRNWEILNKKVFSQLGFHLGMPIIQQLIAPKHSRPDRPSSLKTYPIEKLLMQLRDILGEINPEVYAYRRNSAHIKDPFKKREIRRVNRPFSRQPMSETLWRIEREAWATYGAYKGNPIVWDTSNDIANNMDAQLEAAKIGISGTAYRRIKEQYRAQKRSQSIKNKERDKELKEFWPTICPRKSFVEKDNQEFPVVSDIPEKRPRSRSCCRFSTEETKEEPIKTSKERNPFQQLQRYQIRAARISSCSKINVASKSQISQQKNADDLQTWSNLAGSAFIIDANPFGGYPKYPSWEDGFM